MSPAVDDVVTYLRNLKGAATNQSDIEKKVKAVLQESTQEERKGMNNKQKSEINQKIKQIGAAISMVVPSFFYGEAHWR